jgi:hypothetical protein
MGSLFIIPMPRNRARENGKMGDHNGHQESTRWAFIRNCTAFGAGVLAGGSLFPKVAGGQNTKASQKTEAGEEKSQGDPPVRIPDVSIRMRSPDSLLVGVTLRPSCLAGARGAERFAQTGYLSFGLILTESPEGRSLYSQI